MLVLKMINNLFNKIMGSYILLPILILAVLVIFLPQYLEDYFVEAKQEELIRKSKLVTRLIKQDQSGNINQLLSNLEKMLNTSLVVIDQAGEIVNQGRQMGRMMQGMVNGMMGHGMMQGMMKDLGMKNHGMMGQGMMRNNPLGLKEELDKVLAGEKVVFKGMSPMLGQPVITVGIPVETDKRLALFLIAPIYGLQEMAVKIRNLTLRITLGAIIVALLLGYFITRGITRPLQKMKVQAQRIAAGNFDQQLSDLPNDEIGELGVSFNYMSQKLAQNINALAKEKTRMKEMLTSMTEGVLGIAANEKVMLANPKLKEIFSLEEEIINYNFSDYFPNELIDLVEEVLVNKKEIKREFEWQDQIITAQAAPVKGGDGQLWGIIILIRDVTEIRKLDQMRRLFVANVSHELKTPLTAVRGYLEAILDGVVNSRELEEEYLDRVLKETNRMSDLVTDILDLSRLQAGQIDFEIEEVNLISLIKSVIINLESKLEAREIIIEGSKELIIKTDASKLKEVVINLISNAIKFTDSDGEIKVQIKDNKNQVVVGIIDNGIGIPKAELSYIWERFYQVDRARKPNKEGTGLGLAIVKEIVEGLGGKIEVDSTKGEGSKFKFKLPKNYFH
ncbi:signal transduction histidine kinase [Halobacteroides halobius DSM 5150]|uniref:histidine kinase n=2 Tax=Halobacteroides TaxID=42417 RepID=L0K980_HALHC|nr:signal transduction histidine kinase [Halobacteroides halobius DSM 5150]